MSVPNDRLPVMTASVLDREMFSEAEASRILRVPQSTLHWWLNGGMYGNRKYRPVIRTEPTSGRSVTWAEFVESGLLREYRRTHKVALSELRIVIDRLRDEYGTPIPWRTTARSLVQAESSCLRCSKRQDLTLIFVS
jgi:hypothetical protein